MGWFYGLKLHLIISNKRQIMAVKISPRPTDNKKALVKMVKNFKGNCFAVKGYLSQDLFKRLFAKGLY